MYFVGVRAIALGDGPKAVGTWARSLWSKVVPGLTRLEHVILYAAVAEPALQQIIVGDRVGAAVALGHQHGRIHAIMNKRVAHGIGALLRQCYVRRGIADVVGIAGDLQHGVGRELLDLSCGLLQKLS